MDNKVDLSKGTEVSRSEQSSGISRGFEGNGSFYSENTPQPQKHNLRIQAAIPPKTFDRIVIGVVAASGVAALIAVIKLILFLKMIF